MNFIRLNGGKRQKESDNTTQDKGKSHNYGFVKPENLECSEHAQSMPSFFFVKVINILWIAIVHSYDIRIFPQ
jgi:hypothetical protein